MPAQDLAGSNAFDITALVKQGDSSIVLDGKDLRMIGKSSRPHAAPQIPPLL
ncbi:MAG: hypothetical protein IJD22_02790 [Clostridia bacterium]|nr:hypothetical protein [Clostridia bacterium]